MPTASEFDKYADNYDVALAAGLAVSGEGRDYFARGRLTFLAECLQLLGSRPERVMDFGCGTGDSMPMIREILGAPVIHGVDESARTIERAARQHRERGMSFSVVKETPAEASFDLVYTNGVFHHIPPSDRHAAVDLIYGALAPGGLVSLWENNPWSPGARYVMSKIPFDRDAIMMSAARGRRLLTQGGFEIVRTDYLFIFPAVLKVLRRVEEVVRGLPFGAQYQVLARKR